MRLIILSRQPELYSTRVLVEAARGRGHDVEVLDTLQFDIRVSRGTPELLYQGRPVGPVDAVASAFTPLEVRELARQAGLACVSIRRHWPGRFLLSWST